MARLLYVSPAVPATSGHGSSMRAWATIEALSKQFDVYLLVITLFRSRHYNCDAAQAGRYCQGVEICNPSDLTGLEALRQAVSRFSVATFDIIFSFRLMMAETALHCRQASSSWSAEMWLDLDDFESQTRESFANLASQEGDTKKEEEERLASARFRHMESALLPLFSRIFLANSGDARRLGEMYGHLDVRPWPNVITLPACDEASRTPLQGRITLLFVGTMDYYPNVDGVLFFCRDILPLIRDRCAQQITCSIVGTRPTSDVREIERTGSGIIVTGEVEDVAPYYRAADIVIAPLRAGGGTRVKILEACSYSRPVVTTTIAADGLATDGNTPFLVADSAFQFADACVRLIENVELRTKLGRDGRDWVQTYHTIRSIQCLDIFSHGYSTAELHGQTVEYSER